LKVDNSPSGAIYKGLATGSVGAANFIYATDFHDNKIDVFDGTFMPFTPADTFSDPSIPSGFAPLGIQNVNDKLFVSYAKQDAVAEEDVAGPGLGFIDVFSTDGHLLKHFAAHGMLDAPLGMALAPSDFGRFSGALLVGDFGDGRISAFDPNRGTLLGQIQDGTGTHISIDGLWGLGFGNNGQAGPANELFFAAGPDDEHHGLFGGLTAHGDPGTATVADANLSPIGIGVFAVQNRQFARRISP